MLMQVRIAGFIVAFIAVATNTHEQAGASPATHRFHALVGVGVSIPMSDLIVCCESGLNLLIGAEYAFKPAWAARGEVAYAEFAGKQRPSFIPTSASQIGVMVSGAYYPMIATAQSVWKPYALLGVGYYSNGGRSLGVNGGAGGSIGLGLGAGTQFTLSGSLAKFATFGRRNARTMLRPPGFQSRWE